MPDSRYEPDRRLFEELFAAHGAAVLAYALRRATPPDAEDAVSETFVVAWRRLRDVPGMDTALPWLYGVCRRVLANQRRGDRRRWELVQKVGRDAHGVVTPDLSEPGPALIALARLRDDEQELLRLVAWEQLSHAEIGTVLGITANAVAIRLYRARQRFEQAFRAVADEVDLKDLAGMRTSNNTGGAVSRQSSRVQSS
jgi:DNA-directed RNA polymerase specialized sigma24 family protein